MMEHGLMEYIQVGPAPTDKSLEGLSDRELAEALRYSWVRPFFTLRQCQRYGEREQAWGIDCNFASLAPSDIDALIAATHLAAGWAKALHGALIPALDWLLDLGYTRATGQESRFDFTSRAPAASPLCIEPATPQEAQP
jgi:hypothetical protein